jgi:hypothetical protein
MVERVWQYRGDGFGASDGVLILGDGAIRLRPGVRQFVGRLLGDGRVDGQRPQAGHGRPSLGTLAMFGLVAVMLVSSAVQAVVAGGTTTVGLLNLLGGVAGVLPICYIYLRETTVPLSSVERVTVDRRNDKMTVRYERDSRRSRRLPWPENRTTATKTVEPVGDDVVREVREALCRRGVPVDVVHRVIVGSGEYLCGSCRQQVLPSETTCPSCGSALESESEHTTHDSVEFASA